MSACGIDDGGGGHGLLAIDFPARVCFSSLRDIDDRHVFGAVSNKPRGIDVEGATHAHGNLVTGTFVQAVVLTWIATNTLVTPFLCANSD